MANYDWHEYTSGKELIWTERFPEWAHGAMQWQAQESGPAWQPPRLPGWLPPPPLSQLAYQKPRRPRVFVSHRRADRDQALRVAWLADQEGFEFWLDILDPVLITFQKYVQTHLAPSQKSMAIASIIEMALINSSHVLAVMTPNTKGSEWVPYEYGRVKEAPPRTVQAACWADPNMGVSNLPEYLHLGTVTNSELELRYWFEGQFNYWTTTYGSPGSKPTGAWKGRPPPAL